MCRQKKEVYSLKDEYTQYLSSIENSKTKIYIEQRVLGQMIWYDKKSTHYQKQFKVLTVCSIALSASIPVIVLLQSSNNQFWRIIISITSAIVTVITGALSLYKSKELWLEYRNSCETLKSLLHKYFTNTDIFSSQENSKKDELFISNCEYIMTHEIENWIGVYNKKEHKDN